MTRCPLMPTMSTYADGATQTSVPIRPGQRQGFLVNIYNPTGVTQTILGPGNGIDDPMTASACNLARSASPRPIGTSTAAPAADHGASGTRFRRDTSHQSRMLRVLWISNAYGYFDGALQAVTDLIKHTAPSERH